MEMLNASMKAVLILGLLTATCSGARPTAPASGSSAQAGTEREAKSQEAKMTLSGTLAETVEAGGWVLNTEKGMYLLLFDQKYRQEPWFKAGAKVKVKGEESPDTITVFMQGTPFKVEKMEPDEEGK